MWEGYYGKEPFDLRLTVLRLGRNFSRILLVTLVGTLLFGGGYYVKNVLLYVPEEYTATSTYLVEYVDPPRQTGDYYINDATWNTIVKSETFLKEVEKQGELLLEGSSNEMSAIESEEFLKAENLPEHVSATVPSDWNIPTVTVITGKAELTALLNAAVEAAMVNNLSGIAEAVAEVKLLDPGVTKEAVHDVRPVRALILSALMSVFFVLIAFLLKELGEDSIWLPATIRVRYGLKVLGTVKSLDFVENFQYLFGEKQTIAVCPMDERIDSTEAIKLLKESTKRSYMTVGENVRDTDKEHIEWIALPAPLLCPESSMKLREAEGILLLVPAGDHVGKKLEYVLDFLRQQDCIVTAAVLWEADENLLKAYYGLDIGRFDYSTTE